MSLFSLVLLITSLFNHNLFLFLYYEKQMSILQEASEKPLEIVYNQQIVKEDTIFKDNFLTIVQIKKPLEDTITKQDLFAPDVQIKKKTPKHIIEYIEKNIQFCKEVGDSLGLDYLYLLAQPAIESGWGRSNLAKKGNNLGGIRGKGYGKWQKFKTHKDFWERYGGLIKKYGGKPTNIKELIHNIAYSPYAAYVDKNGKGDVEGAENYKKKVSNSLKLIEDYLE